MTIKNICESFGINKREPVYYSDKRNDLWRITFMNRGEKVKLCSNNGSCMIIDNKKFKDFESRSGLKVVDVTTPKWKSKFDEMRNQFLHVKEGTILGDNTTVSAGIPGDGPIADTQNGLKDTKVQKRNKKKCKLLGFCDGDASLDEKLDAIIDCIDLHENIKEEKILVLENKKLVKDIIDGIGVKEIKKQKTYKKALSYVEDEIEDLIDILNIKEKHIPWDVLKIEIKGIVGE